MSPRGGVKRDYDTSAVLCKRGSRLFVVVAEWVVSVWPAIRGVVSAWFGLAAGALVAAALSF